MKLKSVRMLLTVFFLILGGFDRAEESVALADKEWQQWSIEWEEMKEDWTQLSLTPGRNEHELNFAWYEKDSVTNIPMVKISQTADMKEAVVFSGEVINAVPGYLSEKVTVTGIEPNTTYYYVYGYDDSWSEVMTYQSQANDSFSFIVTSDPQIGASYDGKKRGEIDVSKQEQAVYQDAFRWNQTLKQAMTVKENASFLINVGDQIQSRNRQEEELLYTGNEIEYVGYLSPKLLKSLPVATVIGNHDSPSGNYSFHFNNPNMTGLGQTMAGSDYYYSYGDALFIILNSNSDAVDEHDQLFKEAIASHPDSKWRFVALHHDIYGTGEHALDPDMVELRYKLAPLFEKYQIDVVFSGHDHCYSRSYFLNTAKRSPDLDMSKEDFLEYRFQNKELDEKYTHYLTLISDEEAIAPKQVENGQITNPEGIIYYTLSSASGSKYYDLSEAQPAYIASRWQAYTPTFMTIDVTKDTLTLKTYRADTLELIDEAITIKK